ncbi:DHS-like NAD/FAD-binding domain-containing protein [Trametes maxima]|nr:DHS-like NAD/FAD-binding domain-containing protein [Trametes maxima]
MDDPDELLMMYDGPTKILESRDIEGVAKYMNSPQCQRIFCAAHLLVSAAASAGAGVPNFRYPKKGNTSAIMARLNLPYPRALFELTYFRFNPIPLYTLARELNPGRYRPTPTHSFVKLLAENKTLHLCFTENLDALERQAGIPADRIVEAQGSFGSQSCADCHAEYDNVKLKEAVEKGEVARCDVCSGLIKPNIVFHGDPPPQSFTEKSPELSSADLLFVIGTPLITQPFGSLAALVPQSCPRVLISTDFAGDIGMRSDDVLLLGNCDDVVRDLCKELGWEDALGQEWAKTEIRTSVNGIANGVEKDVQQLIAGAGDIVIDGVSPRADEQPDGARQCGTLDSTEWKDPKESKSDSLTERLRTVLEQSEKPSAHAPDPGAAFVARSLSGEELFADGIGDFTSRTGEIGAPEEERVLVVESRA